MVNQKKFATQRIGQRYQIVLLLSSLVRPASILIPSWMPLPSYKPCGMMRNREGGPATVSSDGNHPGGDYRPFYYLGLKWNCHTARGNIDKLHLGKTTPAEAIVSTFLKANISQPISSLTHKPRLGAA